MPFDNKNDSVRLVLEVLLVDVVVMMMLRLVVAVIVYGDDLV